MLFWDMKSRSSIVFKLDVVILNGISFCLAAFLILGVPLDGWFYLVWKWSEIPFVRRWRRASSHSGFRLGFFLGKSRYELDRNKTWIFNEISKNEIPLSVHVFLKIVTVIHTKHNFWLFNHLIWNKNSIYKKSLPIKFKNQISDELKKKIISKFQFLCFLWIFE